MQGLIPLQLPCSVAPGLCHGELSDQSSLGQPCHYKAQPPAELEPIPYPQAKGLLGLPEMTR